MHRTIGRLWRRNIQSVLVPIAILAVLMASGIDGASAAYAQSQPITPTFSDSESWVLQKIASEEIPDLEDVNNPGSPDRTLSPQFLGYLLTNEAVKAGPKGIRIRNGIVVESLDLELGTFLHDVQLINFHFKGPVKLRDSFFVKGISFAESVFDEDLDFSRARVQNSVFINDARFNTSANFDFASINGNLEADHVRFIHEIDDQTVADSSGSCGPDSIEVNEPVTAGFSGVTIRGHVSFYDAIFSGRARFVLGHVGGNFDLEKAVFINEDQVTEFNGVTIDGSLRLNETIFYGPVDLKFANIALNLRAHNTTFGGHMWPGNSDMSVDLRGGKIAGTAFMDVECFANPISLDGMSYQSINAGGVDQKTALESLFQLVEQAEYRMNVYTNLEQFFRSQGQIKSAEKVLVERKRRERRELLRGIDWVGSYLLDILVLYGLSPERTLIPSVSILIVGWLWFRQDRWMEPQDPNYKGPRYDLMESIWYSLDLFLPFIDLQASKIWTPKRDRGAWAQGRRIWMRVQIISGWTLVPIGLLALTGLFE